LWVETEAEDNICAAHTSVKLLDLHLVGRRCPNFCIDDRDDFRAASSRGLNFVDGDDQDDRDRDAKGDVVDGDSVGFDENVSRCLPVDEK
jgi:hypothetical protein